MEGSSWWACPDAPRRDKRLEVVLSAWRMRLVRAKPSEDAVATK